MNILRDLATATIKARSQKVVMKKERYGKKEKTKRCTYCNLPGTTILFGKDKRTLCKFHLSQLNAKHEQHTISSSTFKKASEL